MMESIDAKLPHYGFDFSRCDLIDDAPHKTYVEWDEICPHCADMGIVSHLDWDEEEDQMNPYKCPLCFHRVADGDLPDRVISIPCTMEEFEAWDSERRQKFWLEKRYGTMPEHISDFWKRGCAS